uniref:lysosomal amino acid transporter 1 homolog n=1 Tax=Styela clava TaxID=7725 RepID=UPI00193A764E|nr:lysosomal amino acid transporter 1 homolog [Styela clava]
MYPLVFDVCSNCGVSNKNSTNLTCESNQTVEWIFNVFHECVDTPKEEVGFILGLVSICCWVCASVPQLIENYRKKHVEEAISFLFLMFWLFGDSSNLIGCLLTGQLAIQIVTAIYYVFMDIVMILQYLYYRSKNRRQAKLERNGVINDILVNGNTRTKNIVVCAFFLAVVPLSFLRRNSESQLVSDFEHQKIGRTLLSTGDVEHGGPLLPTDTEDVIGYAIGCISSLFYLASRLPQIRKNFKRKQTDGVSIHLFILAVAGNALYGTSILLQDPDPGKTYTQFILLHLPWLIGSLGTMSLDFTLLMQILHYNPPCKNRGLNDNNRTEDDEDPLLA